MDLSERKEELKHLLKIDQKEARVAEIERIMSQPDFWQNREAAVAITQELSALQDVIDRWRTAAISDELDRLELQALLSGEYDFNNVILNIYAGAGGTEAQDWSEMLMRMYQRYGERRGFKVEVLDISQGEEAGIKSATMRVVGPYAFGYLKSEDGVHRLVRQSPFDADHARHTSFALVEVVPEIEKAEEVEIDPKDLRIDVYRSSGHGGQSVNTTDSAVRITHIPSGLVVACQNERSQLQNRETAMKILRSRLYKLELEKQKEKEKALKGEFSAPEWGSQIRSYVLHPYQMVKDHRTEAETSNTGAVLNGEIDQFIEAYLKKEH